MKSCGSTQKNTYSWVNINRQYPPPDRERISPLNPASLRTNVLQVLCLAYEGHGDVVNVVLDAPTDVLAILVAHGG